MNKDIDVILKLVDEQFRPVFQKSAGSIASAVKSELGSGYITTEQLGTVLEEILPEVLTASVKASIKALDQMDALPHLDADQTRRRMMKLL